MSQGKLNGTPSSVPMPTSDTSDNASNSSMGQVPSVPMPTSGNASNSLLGQGPLGTTGAAAPQNYQYQFGGSTGAPVIGGMGQIPGQSSPQFNLQSQSGSAPTLQNLQDQIAQLTQQLSTLQGWASGAPHSGTVPQAAPSIAPNPNLFTTGTSGQSIQNTAGGITPAMGVNIAPTLGSTQG